MELTAKNVNQVFLDCLFKSEDDPSKGVEATGVIFKCKFNPERLESHRENIKSMLGQLPGEFMEKTGGGWSFLNACMTKEGTHWGEHTSIDKLICLGLAIGKIEFCMDKEYWKLFPGGVPYFVVKEN